MFAYKKTQVWLTLALLLLCSSISRLSSYPYVPEDEVHSKAAEVNQDDEEDREFDDESMTEDEQTLAEVTGMENDDKKSCVGLDQKCEKENSNCCEGHQCYISMIHTRCLTDSYVNKRTNPDRNRDHYDTDD